MLAVLTCVLDIHVPLGGQQSSLKNVCIGNLVCDRAFIVEWMVQATIQGALGSAPLMLIQTRLKGRPDYAQYEVWGNQILHATAFSIILSAPIGLLVIALLGPLWLKEVLSSTNLSITGHCVPKLKHSLIQSRKALQWQICVNTITQGFVMADMCNSFSSTKPALTSLS